MGWSFFFNHFDGKDAFSAKWVASPFQEHIQHQHIWWCAQPFCRNQQLGVHTHFAVDTHFNSTKWGAQPHLVNWKGDEKLTLPFLRRQPSKPPKQLAVKTTRSARALLRSRSRTSKKEDDKCAVAVAPVPLAWTEHRNQLHVFCIIHRLMIACCRSAIASEVSHYLGLRCQGQGHLCRLRISGVSSAYVVAHGALNLPCWPSLRADWAPHVQQIWRDLQLQKLKGARALVDWTNMHLHFLT